MSCVFHPSQSRGSRAPLKSSVRGLSILLLIFIVLAACVPVLAQDKPTEPTVVQGDANACEINAAMFDYLANILRDNAAERLFVVARLGTGEASRDFNRRRLHNVRTYYKQAQVWNIFDDRFVYAEGDQVKGEGRIEFYLGSKLMLTSLVKRGRDICVTCCDFPYPEYYGFGKKEKRKRRR